MCELSPELYAQWRARCLPLFLREKAGRDLPSERLLQRIWLHQRLIRERLRTLDGREVRVLHPGFWNHGAGPDFRGAVLQFDHGAASSGDIEIDVDRGGWRGHRHATNPAYGCVILHVIWAGETVTPGDPPTLTLEGCLDAPLAELALRLDDLGHDLDWHLGRCSGPLRNLPKPVVLELLRQAARARLQRKASDMAARARQAGWEQAFWEALFGALGYKQNYWPLRQLGELVPSLLSRTPNPDATILQARLLGLSGLLPADTVRVPGGSRAFLRGLWDLWWRERSEWDEHLLPRALWRLHGIRPANHPQRRLALAAHWLAEGSLIQRILEWFEGNPAGRRMGVTLLEALRVEPDGFWERHWTLHAARIRQPLPLLGAQRAGDLAVNVILPWLWVRASTGGNQRAVERAERLYFAWPRIGDNAILRQARSRLLAGPAAACLRTAALQQGLLQIVRDFCDHSNALCQDCPFPRLVQELVDEGGMIPIAGPVRPTDSSNDPQSA